MNNQELLALDRIGAYALDDSTRLVHNYRTGQSCLVTSDVYAALSTCAMFRPLEEHVGSIVGKSALLAGQNDEVRQILIQMTHNGMMVTAAEFGRWISTQRHGGFPEPEAQDTAVAAITTWQRPGALKRLLDSILEHGNPRNFEKLIVVDDSRDPDCLDKNRIIFKEFSAKFDAPSEYVGPPERNALIASLVEKIPHHEAAIRFLIDQDMWRNEWTCGLSRNIALLMSVGHKLVVMDDDVLFEVHEPESVKGGIGVGVASREVRFQVGSQGWPGFRKSGDQDPVGAHLQYLGSSFGQVLDQSGESLTGQSLKDQSVSILEDLGIDSPVLVTQCGTLGDPGTQSNMWVPHLSEASLAPVLQSGQAVRAALENTRAWLGREQLHFSSRSNMSQITGLDNRRDLPPYFPIMRSEDRMFGNTVDYLFPQSVALDYTWAVPHLPMENRTRPIAGEDLLISREFPRFICEWILLRRKNSQPDDAVHRYPHLAREFLNLSHASSQQIKEIYLDDRFTNASQRLTNLAGHMQKLDGTPDLWKQFVQNGWAGLNQQLAGELRAPQLKGKPDTLSEGEFIRLWQGNWKRFADVLLAWPEIREACKELG